MNHKNKPIQCHESGEMVKAAQLVVEVLPGAYLGKFTEGEPVLSIYQIAP
jgi:hypothetical protein